MLENVFKSVRDATRKLPLLAEGEINAILLSLADQAIENIPLIIRENEKDLHSHGGERSEIRPFEAHGRKDSGHRQRSTQCFRASFAVWRLRWRRKRLKTALTSKRSRFRWVSSE